MRLDETEGYFPTVREFKRELLRHGWDYFFASERMFAYFDGDTIDITCMDGMEFLAMLGY